LKLKGVRSYQLMLAPDKATIYPEFLPRWADPAADSATSELLANVGQELYVDTRATLLEARSRFSVPLYYKTDSHWNRFGAWLAFRAFSINFSKKESGLRLLSDEQVRVSKISERGGGDLANFLRLKEVLRDKEVSVDIVGENPIETEQYDFETGQLKASGGNPGIMPPRRPLLVKSKHALNNKKVLWFIDSFGYAMAPFMVATFSETLMLHYNSTDPACISRLVDIYKPDYVFITVVERAARNDLFKYLPPTRVTSSDLFRIISPNGGEELAKGNNYLIKWNTTGAGTDVAIALYKNGGYLQTIAGKAPNTGFISWLIPKSLANGSDYQIKIRSFTDASIFDYSDDRFTIQGSTFRLLVPNGSETWQKGHNVIITWKTGNIGGNVAIALYNAGAYITVISGSTANDGLFEWTVPAEIQNGEAYKIKIRSYVNNVSDFSDSNFIITDSAFLPWNNSWDSLNLNFSIPMKIFNLPVPIQSNN